MSHIFRDDDFLEVIALDFLPIADSFLEQLFQSLQRSLIEPCFRSSVGQIGNALDDLCRRHGVGAVGV